MTWNSAGADRIAAAIDARSREGFALVALDGMGGSGKSTLAAALAERCGSAVVHGDDFYRPMDPQERAGLDPVRESMWTPRASSPCGGSASVATTTVPSTGSPAGAWPKSTI